MKRLIIPLLMIIMLFCSCGDSQGSSSESTAGASSSSQSSSIDSSSEASSTETTTTSETTAATSETTTTTAQAQITVNKDAPTLLYLGHASLRIVTEQGKVIYVDPFAGSAYDAPADLILITHDHGDHTGTYLIKNKNPDCQTITQKEALEGGEHKSFDLGFVKIQAVEAGYNKNHDVKECVGYVLTFANGSTVYISGDTSKTPQMSKLAEMKLDYAFFCCDGEFNMGLEEAAECAKLVGAKHNIPYHNTTDMANDQFDKQKAQQFDAPNKLVVVPGEEITLEHTA